MRPRKRQLTPEQRTVELVRVLLGLDPLYQPLPPTRGRQDYTVYERLARRADPDCKRCSGSGQRLGPMYGSYVRCQCLRAASPSDAPTAT